MLIIYYELCTIWSSIIHHAVSMMSESWYCHSKCWMMLGWKSQKVQIEGSIYAARQRMKACNSKHAYPHIMKDVEKEVAHVIIVAYIDEFPSLHNSIFYTYTCSLVFHCLKMIAHLRTTPSTHACLSPTPFLVHMAMCGGFQEIRNFHLLSWMWMYWWRGKGRRVGEREGSYTEEKELSHVKIKLSTLAIWW